MKKTFRKSAKALAVLASAFVLFNFMSCSSDDDDDNDESQPVASRIVMNGKTYESIKDALAAIPTSGDTGTYTISLLPGTYNEDGLSYKGAASIVFSGKTSKKYGEDVIIAGKGSDQNTSRTRPLFEMDGTGNLILENITLKNTFSRKDTSSSNTQAEALGHDSTGTVAAYNCSFLSHQDTIRTVSKSWFYECYIEGDVDFMWCEATSKVALYENCEIKAVGDEAEAAYIVAPKTNRASKIWKGLVVFNSKLTTENKDTYLFRNPWKQNTTSYNNAAFINVDIAESGDGKINAALLKSQAMGSDDQKNIGWKVDQTIANAYSSKDASIGTVDEALKTAEYAGRNNIINRLYNVATSKYAKDSESPWDVNELATQRNWKVTEDNSKDLLDGEEESDSKVYLLNTETVEGLTCNGFALEPGKTHYVAQQGGTITVPVSKKSVVTVYGYYKANVNIKADNQGEKVYICTNGSTNAVTEENYIVYSAPYDVVITANSQSYLTKIVVESDSSLQYVPVTTINLSCEKETLIAGVNTPITAEVLPADATNEQVKWTSSDESVAKVDEATGIISPVAAGTVTITATARDGSGVTAAKEFSVEKSTWTRAEWYSTGVSTITAAGEENSAFDTGASAGKSLGSSVTFTNFAGESVSTSGGLKLNSAGIMKISTTSSGYLTLITYEGTGTVAQPGVNGTAEKAGTATLVKKNSDSASKLTTYTFVLSAADTYTIDRKPASSEINPIVYAKVELCPLQWDDAEFTTEDNIQNKTGTWKMLYIDATSGKFTDNGASWIQCNTGTIVYVPIVADATIVIQGYVAGYTLTGGDSTSLTDNNDKTYTYNCTYDTDAVTVEGQDGKYAKITMGSDGYWGDITLSYSGL